MAHPRGMVAAGHPLTAQAGADVLSDGGNAVDAALAALLTSWAAEPLLTGPGAGGYMLVAGAGEEPTLLDFFVPAPGLGRPAGTRGELVPITVSFGDAAQIFHVGAASCGPYGCPAGVAQAHARWGSVPLTQLAAPAAAHARAGVALNAIQSYVGELLDSILDFTPATAQRFAPGGARLREGDLFRDSELGDTIERLGSEGADPFYRGDIARTVLDELEPLGGLLTREDLASYEAIARTPATVTYRGRTVLTNPPPSAGGTLLALALGRLDATAGPPSVTEIVDVMADVQGRRDDAFIDGLAQDGFLERFLAANLGATTHISVLDADGRACSVTTTNGEGSGLVVPGTGIHLNNIMGEEDLNPRGFFAYPAGRRMPSMMAPTIVVGSGGVELVVGSAGSNRIRSAILQTIVGVVDHGLGAGAAVDAPRVHFEDGVVYAEPGIDVAALESSGRQVQPFRDRNLFFGGTQAVELDPRSGELSGAGDPRRGGAAVAA
jgi:gamma-glutamyltranspeptidase / glutathione hydrolase